MKLESREVWQRDGEVAVDVVGLSLYRVVITAKAAHILAPGVDEQLDLEEEWEDMEPESLALMLVARFEGGVLA